MSAQINDMSENLSLSPCAKTVHHLVQKVQLLQKAMTEKQTVSQATMEQQRQAMAELKKLASKEPMGVMGYVTACCITETNLNHLFDFQRMTFSHADKAQLKAFFEPQYIFALFQKYQILQKVDLPVFASDFPDLGHKPFNLKLYDVLNDQKNGALSFSDQLGSLFKERYTQLNPVNLIEKRARHRLQIVIEDLAQKKYPSLQLLSAQIAEKNNEPALMKEYLNALLCNKYASEEQGKYAREMLRTAHQKSYRFQKSSLTKHFERNA